MGHVDEWEERKEKYEQNFPILSPGLLGYT